MYFMLYFLNMVERANKNDLNNIILRKKTVDTCLGIYFFGEMLEEDRIITESRASFIVIIN